MKIKEHLNKYPHSTSRIDFFIIWNNSEKFYENILDDINSSFKILKIKKIKFFSKIFFLMRVYKFNFPSIYFAFYKYYDLKKTKNEALFVFVLNENYNINASGKNHFRNIICKKIEKFKLSIRSKYKNNVIHSGDNYFDLLRALKITKLFKKRIIYLNINNLYNLFKNNNETKKIKLNKFTLSELYATQFVNKKIFKNRKIVKIDETAQFLYFKEKNIYRKYLSNFLGKGIYNFHSVKKYQQLIYNFQKIIYSNKINKSYLIKVKKDYKNRKIIIDGTHRAAISKKYNQKYIYGYYI